MENTKEIAIYKHWVAAAGEEVYNKLKPKIDEHGMASNLNKKEAKLLDKEKFTVLIQDPFDFENERSLGFPISLQGVMDNRNWKPIEKLKEEKEFCFIELTEGADPKKRFFHHFIPTESDFDYIKGKKATHYKINDFNPPIYLTE